MKKIMKRKAIYLMSENEFDVVKINRIAENLEGYEMEINDLVDEAFMIVYLDFQAGQERRLQVKEIMNVVRKVENGEL